MKIIIFAVLIILSCQLAYSATEIKDEGTSQGYINVVDCVGSGIACTRSGITGTLSVAGGAATAAGDTTQVQYNVGDALSADPGFVWNETLNNLSIAGDLTISGDNVTATTNTDRFVFMANGSTYAPEAIDLGTDTAGNYVATIADAGNTTITVANSGTENAAVTLDVIDLNCTNCIGPTEITDITLGTDTSGNYAIGDAEAGAALSGDTATAFFATGVLEIGIGGTGVTSISNDAVLVGNNAGTGFDKPAFPNCLDSGGNHLNYTSANNAFSCGTSSGPASAGGSNANVQYASGTSLAGDTSFNWNASSNMLGISRDSAQQGYAIAISGDLVTQGTLANISHDGTAHFQAIQLNNALSVDQGGTGFTTYSKGDLITSPGTTLNKLTVGANGTILSADSTQTNGISWVAPVLPLTTKGDIYGYNTAPTRIAVGPAGNILSTDSTNAAGVVWVSRDTVLPVTAKGSLISYSTKPLELSVGSNGKVLSADSSTTTGLVWSDPGAVTTKGDIEVFGSARTRLAVGSDGQILSADASTATGLKWIVPVLPLTTKGDLYTYQTAPARIAVGASDGMVLSVDSTTATGLKWGWASGGGGSTSPANPKSSVQFNNNGSFGGDQALVWDSANNMLSISRDTSQVGKAINISSDVAGTTVANISHDGAALFQSVQFPDLGFIMDANGKSIMSFDAVSSAVNRFVIVDSAAGTSPIISSDGADANIDLKLNTKGTGGVVIQSIATPTQSTIASGLSVNNSSTNSTAGTFMVLSADGSRIVSSDPTIGGISTTGKFISYNATDLGWTFVNGTDNTACNTQCRNACVIGILNATGTAVTGFVDCTGATADECICAGPA